MKQEYNVICYTTYNDVIPKMTFVQHDTAGKIQFTIYEDIGVAMTGIISADAKFTRPDASSYTFGMDYIVIEGNVVTLTMPPASVFTDGKCNGSLSVYDVNGGRITAVQFPYTVKKELTGATPIDTTNEYPILTTLINNVQTASDSEDIRVASETTRVSSENARISSESLRASSEITRQSNETGRQTTFAANETDRASTFSASEAVRTGTFNISETGRTNTFNASEAERTDTFNSSESSRSDSFNTSEAGRTTAFNNAESIREAHETTRLTSESARQVAETNRVNAEASRVSVESARAGAEVNRVNAESSRVTSETGRVNAEASRVTAETNRVTEFNTIKDEITLFDVLPVTTVRNSIELNPLGTYNYVSGNTVTANSLTTLESGQTDLNYAVTLQVSNEKVYSKTSYGFEVDKMIRDIMLTQ